jgi:hypothetical protein
MKNFRKLSGTKLRLGDFALGSLESRAAARAAIIVPPDIIVKFESARGTRDADGMLTGPPPEPQYGTADDLTGTRIERDANETVEDFKDRLLAKSTKKPRICFLFPPQSVARTAV